MKQMTRPFQLALTLAAAFALTSCTTVSRLINPGPKVIHALPDQEQLASPLYSGATPLMEALTFSRGSFTLAESQKLKLAESLSEWKNGKRPLLIAGFASSSSVPDYGRVLSQRRAEAVRAALIELGFNAGALHTTGYGSDITALSPGDVVRIYEAKQQAPAAEPEQPAAAPSPAA